jgi:hypothetical protein
MFPEVPTRAESWRIFKNPSKRGVCCGLSGLKKPITPVGNPFFATIERAADVVPENSPSQFTAKPQ